MQLFERHKVEKKPAETSSSALCWAGDPSVLPNRGNECNIQSGHKSHILNKCKSELLKLLHFHFTLQPVHISSIWCRRLLPVFQYCNPGWIRFSSPQVNPSLLWHWHQSCHSFSSGYPLLERSSSLGSSPYPELRQLSQIHQLKSHPIHSHFHSLILHATVALSHDIHHQGWPVVLNAVRSNSHTGTTEMMRFIFLLGLHTHCFTSL